MDPSQDPKVLDLEKSSQEDVGQVDEFVLVDPKAEARLLRRIDARFVPASMLVVLLSFFDRANIRHGRFARPSNSPDKSTVSHRIEERHLLAWGW
ncbi:hypothetical protein PHLGIDRAFT_117745 [Phlebiopsis gigantea 11061_1 CR5-6]|uniref:Uncharacterized protein n=1 Tax=Phlebiopsis gigantea (strain 11061_1 CR5-6) TaxID=745531 RepID=A0A0C3S906_PHLG1|nr:hypothetical protein PHLGIDRAFT_117745 [Phlebiopsis gigantea 11061_1 CR5-6]